MNICTCLRINPAHTGHLQTLKFSTTTELLGKRNFRKFLLHNKRGTRLYKEQVQKDENYPLHDLGVRKTGVKEPRFVPIPEMIPEMIVPDLTDFKLKPYVSYRAVDVIQSEFTSLDLFKAVYHNKIVKDYRDNKLDGDGNPLEPSQEEAMTRQEALNLAKSTGSDIL